MTDTEQPLSTAIAEWAADLKGGVAALQSRLEGLTVEPLYADSSEAPRVPGRAEGPQAGFSITETLPPTALASQIEGCRSGGVDEVRVRLSDRSDWSVLPATRVVLAGASEVPPALVADASGHRLSREVWGDALRRGTALELSTVAERAATDPAGSRVALSGAAVRDAGSSAATELAFLVATAAELIRTADGAWAPRAGQLAFETAIDTDVFLEVAKLRALRQLWAGVASHYGVDGQVRVRAVGCRCSWSRLDAHTNMLRAASSVYAAAVGGADEVEALPHAGQDREAQRLARNTSIVLREEALLGQVQDPAAGSGYVEALTEQLAERAWSVVQAWEKAGGASAVFASGQLKAEVEAEAQEVADAYAQRRRRRIGVNVYPAVTELVAAHEPRDAATRSDIALRERRWSEPFENLVSRGRGFPEPQRRVAIIGVGPLRAHRAASDAAVAFVGLAGLRADVLEGCVEAAQAQAHVKDALAVIWAAGSDSTELAATLRAQVKPPPSAAELLSGWEAGDVPTVPAAGDVLTPAARFLDSIATAAKGAQA